TMTDQEMNTEPTSETTPKQSGLGRLAAIGAGIVVVVLLASVAGAVVGHELWTSTTTATPAPAPTPSSGAPGNFGRSRTSGGSAPEPAARPNPPATRAK